MRGETSSSFVTSLDLRQSSASPFASSNQIDTVQPGRLAKPLGNLAVVHAKVDPVAEIKNKLYFYSGHDWIKSKLESIVESAMIHLQVHLQVPCYDFCPVQAIAIKLIPIVKKPKPQDSSPQSSRNSSVPDRDGRCVQRAGT